MSDVADATARRLRLMVFGDSICEGSNVPGGGPDDAWTRLFAAAADIDLVNRSRGGRPTDSLDEFRSALGGIAAADCRMPDALLIALGTNDSRDLAVDMPVRAAANVASMAALARAAGIPRVVVAAPYNIDGESLRQSHPIRVERDRNLRLLGEAYRALAGREGLGFISFYGWIPTASLAADGVHPDPAGNRAVCARALVELLPLLR